MAEILSPKPCCANCVVGALDVGAFANTESVDIVASFNAAGVRSGPICEAIVEGNGVRAESVVVGTSIAGIGGDGGGGGGVVGGGVVTGTGGGDDDGGRWGDDGASGADNRCSPGELGLCVSTSSCAR